MNLEALQFLIKLYNKQNTGRDFFVWIKDQLETNTPPPPKEREFSFPCVATAYRTQKFGVNPRVYGQMGLDGHNGVDYGAPKGSDIYACADGRVVFANVKKTGYGRHVRIQHNGFLSLYGHLLELKVKKGQPIEAGDVIGTMGGDPRDGVDYDGYSTGTHLHFEIRPGGEGESNGYNGAVPPIKFLEARLPSPKSFGRVIVRSGLNTRIMPDVNSKKLNPLSSGDKIGIINSVKTGNNTWVRMRALRPRWCASIWKNRVFVKIL